MILINVDMNVFRGVTQNYYFMSVFVITVGLQIIIMFFGSIVFSIPTGGLTAGGWAASVCLPLGTFVVGILVRLLPSKEWKDISDRFREAEKAIEESIIDVSAEAPIEATTGALNNAPLEVLQEKSEEIPSESLTTDKPASATVPVNTTDDKRAQSNWKRAIEKTQMQIKVIRAFQIPAEARSSISSLNSQIIYRNSPGASRRESSFVSTIRGGRTNAADYIAMQVVDANDARDKAQGRE
jgi:hypothetical protein